MLLCSLRLIIKFISVNCQYGTGMGPLNNQLPYFSFPDMSGSKKVGMGFDSQKLINKKISKILHARDRLGGIVSKQHLILAKRSELDRTTFFLNF